MSVPCLKRLHGTRKTNRRLEILWVDGWIYSRLAQTFQPGQRFLRSILWKALEVVKRFPFTFHFSGRFTEFPVEQVLGQAVPRSAAKFACLIPNGGCKVKEPRDLDMVLVALLAHSTRRPIRFEVDGWFSVFRGAA